MPRSSNTQHVTTTLVNGDSQVIQHSSSCYNYPGHWWQPGLLVSVSHCLISCSSAVCCLTGLSIRSSAESRCEWERVVRGIVSSMSHSQMLTREHCPAPVLQSASVNHKHSHCLTTTVTWRRMTGYSTNISIYSLSILTVLVWYLSQDTGYCWHSLSSPDITLNIPQSQVICMGTSYPIMFYLQIRLELDSWLILFTLCLDCLHRLRARKLFTDIYGLHSHGVTRRANMLPRPALNAVM